MTRRRIRRCSSFSRPSAPEPAAAKLSDAQTSRVGCLRVRLPGGGRRRRSADRTKAPSLLRTSRPRARQDTRQEEAASCQRTTMQAGVRCSTVFLVAMESLRRSSLSFALEPSSAMRVLSDVAPHGVHTLCLHTRKDDSQKQLCGLWMLNRLSTCEMDSRRWCLCWR